MHRLAAWVGMLWMAAASATPSANDTELRYRMVEGSAGVPIQIVEAGDPANPGVLFIHGFSLSSSSWHAQLQSELAADFHLVAMDLRGHGNSGKPWVADGYNDSRIWADDVAAVIAATGLERPVVVAWSYGGHVTMDYVRHYSAAGLAGIVFVGSAGGMLPFPPPDDATIADFARLTVLAMSGDAGNRLEAARDFVTGMIQTPLPAEAIDREVAAVLAVTPVVRTAMQSRELDNSDLMDALTLPVLFIVGDHERTTDPEELAALAGKLPDAKLTSYPDTGHMPFLERSERFNQELRRFAER